jgi:putative selenate reductase
VVTGYAPCQVAQTRQILHIADLCNECGNCATFCVHQGKPYADKPRLFLRQSDFEQEADNAFYITGNTIRRRAQGHEAQLTIADATLTFQNAAVRLTLAPDLTPQTMQLKQPFTGALDLRPAAEMLILFKGLTSSAAYLPILDK